MASTSKKSKNIDQETAELTEMFNNISLKEKEKPKKNRTAVDSREISPTQMPVKYDLDHDVVMRSSFNHNSLIQVPDPGFFSGDTSETDLFCELCEDTFNTAPNTDLPEDIKVNFVKSRLRGSARNWYLSKYKNNLVPATMLELLLGLKGAFNNVGSVKLAKIKLVSLRHNYGNINKYIEEFRTLTCNLNFEEEPSALLFYVGLHPKYQEEIQKLETFPETLESIITTCILLENTLKNTMKIRESISHNKNKNNRKNRNNNNNNFRNKNRYNNNNYRNNYQSRNNNFNNRNNNSNNENTVRAQKITTKN